jgi:V/A-type H+/Na+-transporting ATPase subunit I
MIVPMTRLRILGPRDALDPVIAAAQDLGRLHVVAPADRPGLEPPLPEPAHRRHERQVERRIAEADEALRLFGIAAGTAPRRRPAVPLAVRSVARAWREAQRFAARDAALRDERAELERHQAFLAAVLPVVRRLAGANHVAVHAVVVPDAAVAAEVERGLRRVVGDALVAEPRPLKDGAIALVLVLPAEADARLDAALAEARLPETSLPAGYAGGLASAAPRMAERLAALPELQRDLEAERRRAATAWAIPLVAARAVLADWYAAQRARVLVALAPRSFVLEGWVPSRLAAGVAQALAAVADDVVVEPVARSDWQGEDAPVVLQNPRIFRPFERLLALLPLPRYGSLDPTPFMAVFFPLLFGVMLGDVGYALLIAGIAWWLRRGANAGSMRRDAADIATACAAFTAAFGVAFGEFFGDLPHRLFGWHAPWMNREHAIMAAIALAVGLGLVHVVLGLVLGAITDARRAPRHALGRGLSAVMLLLVTAALLAAVDVLPRGVMTPAAIALLVAFPVLIAAEGIIAPVEFLATIGNVLSYARIMAIGTASVMLAVVANSMVGAIGSTVVGVIFALLFHAVNFAIGCFSPAIHALRLHYVEFFGKCYEPGGRAYAPLTHWSPSAGRPATSGVPS